MGQGCARPVCSYEYSDETRRGTEGLQVRNLSSRRQKWKFAGRTCLPVRNGTTTERGQGGGKQPEQEPKRGEPRTQR